MSDDRFYPGRRVVVNSQIDTLEPGSRTYTAGGSKLLLVPGMRGVIAPTSPYRVDRVPVEFPNHPSYCSVRQYTLDPIDSRICAVCDSTFEELDYLCAPCRESIT